MPPRLLRFQPAGSRYNPGMIAYTRRRLLAAASLAGAARALRAASAGQVRLGVTTDEIDEDLLAAARFLKEFGLSWAEVRNLWGKYNTSLPLEKIREAKSILEQHSIRLSILSTGFFKIPLPPDTPQGRAALDNQWSLLDGAMERAAIFGTDKIRVFAFTCDAKEKPDPKAYGRIYELVGEAARRAKARRFRLALENVGESYVWTGAQAAKLLKAVPADNLGLTWDPNNAAAGGERSFPEGYEQLDPARIFHVHLRDYRHNAAGKVEWCAVGDGEFDNLGQIRALLKAGYQESFTLETHWRSPQGKAHATRTSLTALLRVIEQV